MKTHSTTYLFYKLHQNLFDAVCVAALVLNLSACNSGEEGVAADPPADFNQEVYSHQFWSQLSPVGESSKEYKDTEELTEIVDTHVYHCTNDIYSMTETPKEFVAIDPDTSIMWLGNLIQGDSHLQVGSLEELGIRERAPLNISINLLRSDNYRIVDHPSMVTVNAAIGELVENAVAAGHEASTNVYFESREAHSRQQTSLELGFTAEYLGSQAETSLSVDKQGEEHTFFAYFIQNAFTVSMELPTSPQDMVTDELTESKLDDHKARDQIGEDNPPLYVSSMTYGRVLIYKMTSTHEKERIQAAINASYNGISGESDYDLQETLSKAKIEIYAFGGNQANIEDMIRSGELSEYFTGDTKLTSMQPISFELRNLQDNTVAEISRTTEYNVKQCKYVTETMEPIGQKVTVIFDKVYIPSDCDGGIDKGDIFGRFDVINTDADGNEKTKRVVTIDRSDAVGVQSGNTLVLGKHADRTSGTFVKYYGRTFRISGELNDADGGSRGADDKVGNWNANQFDISTKEYGTHTKKAVSNCNGNNPVLTYRLVKGDYIYE